MKSKSILLLGGSGTLGNAIRIKFTKNKVFRMFSPSSNKINFNNKNVEKNLTKILKENNFDIIINCAGVFGFNDKDFHSILNVNTYSNWLILKYLIYNVPNKKTKIIFIGSSAYNQPRKNYILYTASKAALNSIFKSANDYFIKSKKIKFFILHPKRFKSNMTNIFDEKSFKTKSSTIANKIYRIVMK